MNLNDQTTLGAAPVGAAGESALSRCHSSRGFEEAGDYEAAAEALGGLWAGVSRRPCLEGLGPEVAAEVLLRAGVLTGYLGSARQVAGAQEAAKDLIGEAARAFESLGLDERAIESRAELALCYWREGALDEARLLLREVLGHSAVSEVRALALLRGAIVEKTAGRFHEALATYTEAAPLFDSLESHSLKGRFHNGLANVLKNLGADEEREDYTDRALIEYAAASYHFELAGHKRYLARVENNGDAVARRRQAGRSPQASPCSEATLLGVGRPGERGAGGRE